MTASASKLAKTLRLKGASKIDNKTLAAGALTARTNLSTESADNELNLEVRLRLRCFVSYSLAAYMNTLDPAEVVES